MIIRKTREEIKENCVRVLELRITHAAESRDRAMQAQGFLEAMEKAELFRGVGKVEYENHKKRIDELVLKYQ